MFRIFICGPSDKGKPNSIVSRCGFTRTKTYFEQPQAKLPSSIHPNVHTVYKKLRDTHICNFIFNNNEKIHLILFV
jgi:hypothetical protein